MFEMWSNFHIMMILSSVILPFILYHFVKNKPRKVHEMITLVIIIIMMVAFIFKSVSNYFSLGMFTPQMIPLQVCYFAFITYFVALKTKSKVAANIAWNLNFMAGLMAVIFANTLLDYNHLLDANSISYILIHSGIVIGGIFMVLTNIIEIDYASFKRSMPYVTLMYISSIFINNTINIMIGDKGIPYANYFFTYRPVDGTPLKLFYDLGTTTDLNGFRFNLVYIILFYFGAFIIYSIGYKMYHLLKHNIQHQHTAELQETLYDEEVIQVEQTV